jgi:hypothetical protein
LVTERKLGFVSTSPRRGHVRGVARPCWPASFAGDDARTKHLGITSISLQGIDNAEIIDTVHARRVPMVQVNALLPR